MEDVNAALQAYEQDYLNHASNTQEMAKLEQDFFSKKHNTWITALDTRGSLKYAGDFFMEIKLDRSEESALSDTTITVPLYSFINVEDFSSNQTFLTPWIEEGGMIAMEGLIMNNQPVIQRMGRNSSNLRDESRLENHQMVSKEYEVLGRLSAVQYREQYSTFLVKGTITKVRVPEGAGVSRYTNHLFLDRIKAFPSGSIVRRL
ncbi:hypothetical protein ACFSQ7_12480 [Paenibacillus rhizoplanae]